MVLGDLVATIWLQLVLLSGVPHLVFFALLYLLLCFIFVRYVPNVHSCGRYMLYPDAVRNSGVPCHVHLLALGFGAWTDHH